MKHLLSRFTILLLVLSACRTTYQAKTYDFPTPVDTTDKEIELQEKKQYSLEEQGIYASNQFDGARLNNFEWIEDNFFQATISPENIPINPSPYYAFKVWAKEDKNIRLELNYENARHRYAPKISLDGRNWEKLDSHLVELATDSTNAILNLTINADTLWIAAQEVQNSTHVRQWCEEKALHPNVQLSSIGKSKLGRDLWMLDIGAGEKQDKEVIVILSRQHPPEVTGYFAMQAFIDEILDPHVLAKNFRDQYRLLVFPLLNPDGVDLGHWRHNAGGIDLNRDWAYYHQPENRQIANAIVEQVERNNAAVILGLDFHSTYFDVYYTNREIPKYLPHFKDYWIWSIREALGENGKESPSNIGAPVSKNWFITQFGALGITYEIGDTTPRDFIKTKGQVSAKEMMKLLILRKGK